MIPEGVRVRLLPQPEEGQPEQFGTSLGEDCGTVMVELDREYWDSSEMDGLREVPAEFVEVIVEDGDYVYEKDHEPESENSKHCDAGYMNDMRFGDGPDY